MKILFVTNQKHETDTWVRLLQQALPEAEIINWHENLPATGAEMAVVWSPPKQLLENEPDLCALFNLGAGVDGILKLPGLHNGIAIYRIEDAGMSAQMAEYVVHALVRVSRSLGSYNKQQSISKWHKLPDITRSEWPVGVMGMGVMGARTAQAIAALDYPVAGWSTSPKNIDNVKSYVGQQQFNEFLTRTRVLVNLLPLTKNTANILNRANMARLLPDCHIINVGRGDHLVEEDLLEMLDQGHIGGATLDVFKQEPLPAEHPFWAHPKITVTPHISAANLFNETVAQIAKKVRDYIQNKNTYGDVQRGRGY